MADQPGSSGQKRTFVPPWRSRWRRLWGIVLTLVVFDLLILLIGPLLWAGGHWNAATLKFSLMMAVGVDVLMAIAMWWSLFRRPRAGSRPPHT